jgi:hypothetical protein
MEMIISRSKPNSLGAAIFYGGLIAGMLDAVDGFVANYFAAGFNPIQVLQFIASGFYGAAAFQKGISGALVGLLAHFFIAFAAAAIYVGANRFLPMLSRDVVMWGTIYGAAVFIVMNFDTAHSRLEITLVFAALAERGSRARVVRWLTDRLGSPTHYKPVQLQYSGGLSIKLIGSRPEALGK